MVWVPLPITDGWLEAQLVMIFKMVVAMVLAGIIGYERERHGKPAGLRTHMLLALGSAIFTMLSITAFSENADQSRMAAYILVGIGFIGAGTVLQMRDRVIGLTTAASVWLTSAISIAVALGFYIMGISGALLGYMVLRMKFKRNGGVRGGP